MTTELHGLNDIRYRLGAGAASRRARALAGVGAASSLAPIVLAAVLVARLGWRPPPVLWAIAGAAATLVLTRGALAYHAARRRLRTLSIVATEVVIRTESPRGNHAIDRGRVARITEFDGPLGGLRIESRPEPGTEAVTFVHVPHGGDAFGDLRARLEEWRPIERRGRRSPLLRVALGAVIVAGFFFVPFLLEDFVARSKIVAVTLVLGTWLAMRAALRRA